MGSSHSAPRRPSARRSMLGQNAQHNSNGQDADSDPSDYPTAAERRRSHSDLYAGTAGFGTGQHREDYAERRMTYSYDGFGPAAALYGAEDADSGSFYSRHSAAHSAPAASRQRQRPSRLLSPEDTEFIGMTTNAAAAGSASAAAAIGGMASLNSNETINRREERSRRASGAGTRRSGRMGRKNSSRSIGGSEVMDSVDELAISINPSTAPTTTSPGPSSGRPHALLPSASAAPTALAGQINAASSRSNAPPSPYYPSGQQQLSNPYPSMLPPTNHHQQSGDPRMHQSSSYNPNAHPSMMSTVSGVSSYSHISSNSSMNSSLPPFGNRSATMMEPVVHEQQQHPHHGPGSTNSMVSSVNTSISHESFRLGGVANNAVGTPAGGNGGSGAPNVAGRTGPPSVAGSQHSQQQLPPQSQQMPSAHDEASQYTQPHADFFPQGSRRHEWMGRSIETLILGYGRVAPILCLLEDEDDRRSGGAPYGHGGYGHGGGYGIPGSEDGSGSVWGPQPRRRSTISTLGSELGRRSSLGSFPGSRRGSLVGRDNPSMMHGGTLANYYNRRRGTTSGPAGNASAQGGPVDANGYERGAAPGSRRGSAATSYSGSRRGSASHGPSYRRRMSVSRMSADGSDGSCPPSSSATGGPNVVFSLMAREYTGRGKSKNPKPMARRLKDFGGQALFASLDRPAGGICSEVTFLSEVIDSGDWSETQAVISRIAPRLIGDPAAAMQAANDGARGTNSIDDAHLPPNASRYYAGGGRLGLERDAFVLAGGIDVLMRIFREPGFVGEEMAQSYDARDLSEELVATRLAACWNEVLISLRELVDAIPSLVEHKEISDGGEFVPFLFTLLAHDSCFDSAAPLIEEILSLQSHSPPQPLPDVDALPSMEDGPVQPVLGRSPPPTTFFLGNVTDLYKLWEGFNCRQLAHFCRILALLVFEPEDRQLLESPTVLKSIELLQLRRNRAARAGRDSTVDMNQSIMLGDEQLVGRLLKLLRIMNFAPTLRRSSPYHVMAHFPFIADTLVMLGLNELDNWDDVDRMEELARQIIKEWTPSDVANGGDTNGGGGTSSSSNEGENGEPANDGPPAVSDLGSVATMLEQLSNTLMGNATEPSNQLGHIIHVISAAQQAGVVVGRNPRNSSRRLRRSTASRSYQDGSDDDMEEGDDQAQGINPMIDPMFAQQLQDREAELDDIENNPSIQVVGIGLEGANIRDSLTGQTRSLGLRTPEDAANSLQFNALLLGPYQVEVLFVLCTLLGGRRKLDAQDILNELSIISILDDMFGRLPWDSLTATRQPIIRTSDEDQNGAGNGQGDQQPHGIHGPGCDCTPESALCVQYLRLLHNFCDRDCDNYSGRRLLLSQAERRYVFDQLPNVAHCDISNLTPGLLSKVIAAFVGESEESPYRFWLASCIESYLRGSSATEQVFVAHTGLLENLIADITSERLHCAGSLQTSFDLLGELCKGNAQVLDLLVSNLDEEKFRKLMSVAAANLVDSNVFIRSLILSLERLSSAKGLMPLHIDEQQAMARRGSWSSHNGDFSRNYLSHSWWDTRLVDVQQKDRGAEKSMQNDEAIMDSARSSDWFPSMGMIQSFGIQPPAGLGINPSVGMNDSVGHFGWVFTPSGDMLNDAAHAPNTVERLSWFLSANQTRLLRDLLRVVDLRNINHENICCLNTAVVIAIFAHRRNQLHILLQDLRRMNEEEKATTRRAIDATHNDNVIDRAFVQAMKYLDIDRETPPAPYTRRASLTRRGSTSTSANDMADRNDVMRNFREVLWFWFEYYTHRGRDRLSLEFSSHLRFQEWIEVVSLLGADNGSPTALVRRPIRLPRSPYQRAPRIADGSMRST